VPGGHVDAVHDRAVEGRPPTDRWWTVTDGSDDRAAAGGSSPEGGPYAAGGGAAGATLAALHRAVRPLIRARTPEDVADTVVETAVEVLGYERVAVWMREERADARDGSPDGGRGTADPPGVQSGDDERDGGGGGDSDCGGNGGGNGDERTTRASPRLLAATASAREALSERGTAAGEAAFAGQPADGSTLLEADWLGTSAVRLVRIGSDAVVAVGEAREEADGGDADVATARTTADLLELLAADAAVALELARRQSTLGADRDRFATLFASATDAIAEVEYREQTPIVRRVNATFESTFGVEESSIAGDPLSEAVAPAGAEGTVRDLAATARDEGDVEREVRRRADGEVREFLLRVVRYTDEDDPVRAYAVYTDLTERKRAERTLGRLHETARDLMVADTTEEIAQVTAGAAAEVLQFPLSTVRLYDEGAGELVPAGRSAQVQTRLPDRPAYGPGDGIVWQVYESGRRRTVEDVSSILEEVIDPERIRSTVSSVTYLPLGEHGVITLGTADGGIDESDVRLAEILAANAEVALDRATRTALLRRRERELSRQNERLEEFASVVSHDLRNPLSVAAGYLDVLRGQLTDTLSDAGAAPAVDEGENGNGHGGGTGTGTGTEGGQLPTDVMRSLDRIERAHGRMERLISDLLTLAREGQQVGETTPVRLGEAARRAWAGVDTADATLSLEGDRRLRADPDRLASLFENLFRNAVVHGGPTVTVRVGPTADGFFVADDGPGIPPDERDRVFERGYSTGGEGTGFGLSIVRGVAQAHGWTVGVEAAADGGARFVVSGVDSDGDTDGFPRGREHGNRTGDGNGSGTGDTDTDASTGSPAAGDDPATDGDRDGEWS
jgi:PAS domain S-box-containing protein